MVNILGPDQHTVSGILFIDHQAMGQTQQDQKMRFGSISARLLYLVATSQPFYRFEIAGIFLYHQHSSTNLTLHQCNDAETYLGV